MTIHPSKLRNYPSHSCCWQVFQELGKPGFVREQAKLTNPNGRLEDTYCLGSVRPDWHEPSDLLGYTTRLSGKAEYVVTDVLHFIVKAWKELLRCGIRLEEGQTDRYTRAA